MIAVLSSLLTIWEYEHLGPWSVSDVERLFLHACANFEVQMWKTTDNKNNCYYSGGLSGGHNIEITSLSRRQGHIIFRPILLIHFERLKSRHPQQNGWSLFCYYYYYYYLLLLLYFIVSFLKRAQIFAADVWYRFNGKGYGEFKDIHTITMFADYRYAVQEAN